MKTASPWKTGDFKGFGRNSQPSVRCRSGTHPSSEGIFRGTSWRAEAPRSMKTASPLDKGDAGVHRFNRAVFNQAAFFS